MPHAELGWRFFFYWVKVNGKRGEGRGRPASGVRRDRRAKTETERMGGRQGPFIRDHSECAQVALLLATAEDIGSKGRPVQMPEH